MAGSVTPDLDGPQRDGRHEEAPAMRVGVRGPLAPAMGAQRTPERPARHEEAPAMRVGVGDPLAPAMGAQRTPERRQT
ncbi:unnamed protein product [Gadus morhua 'NCC']